MRWRFHDPKNPQEAAERGQILGQIDAWWRAFQNKAEDLAALFTRQKEWDLPAWMAQHLGFIDERICWEYGPPVRGAGHRLVLTPESAHHLRPLVRTILERAPALDGWEFYEYRPAEDLESAQLTVQGGTEWDISAFEFRAARGDQQRIDLAFTAPSIADPEDQSALGAAFLAAEALLGEHCLENWIGAVELVPAAQASSAPLQFRDLGRLQESVQALIGSMRDQLPPQPHCDWLTDDAEWTLWELTPQQADDYCGQQDLVVAKSPDPALWMAAHSGRLFSSERFSRCGETFCYVKIDGSAGLPEGGFADKAEIEDALDDVLKPAKLGCQIGGGMGLRYAYIDVALTDVEKGIETVRKRLQAGKVPKRSWIQFHDGELAAEWVGVYDDSPEPPMGFEA